MKEVVEDINTVPEHQRHYYVEKDGKHVLDDPHKGIGEQIRNLEKSVSEGKKITQSANAEAATARTTLKEFKTLLGELGLDAEDTEKFKDQFKEMQDKIAKGDAGKINWDKLRTDLEKAHAKALEEKDGVVRKMHTKLERHLIEKEAISAIAAAKGVPELLLPHILKQVKVVEDGDDYTVQVVDSSGDPRGNAKGGLMTIADLVAELKTNTTYARAFDGDERSGSGSSGTRTSTSQQRRQSAADMSPSEKIAAGLKARRR